MDEPNYRYNTLCEKPLTSRSDFKQAAADRQLLFDPSLSPTNYAEKLNKHDMVQLQKMAKFFNIRNYFDADRQDLCNMLQKKINEFKNTEDVDVDYEQVIPPRQQSKPGPSGLTRQHRYLFNRDDSDEEEKEEKEETFDLADLLFRESKDFEKKNTQNKPYRNREFNILYETSLERNKVGNIYDLVMQFALQNAFKKDADGTKTYRECSDWNGNGIIPVMEVWRIVRKFREFQTVYDIDTQGAHF
jgi:hypothetical protein